MQMHSPSFTLIGGTLFYLLAVGVLGHVPVTRTSLGKIVGLLCDDDPTVASFRGIPYAKPPLGRLRWAAPVKYNTKYPNNGLNASFPGPSCRQPTEGDEDCLYLNVWAPANVTSRLPVRVFIHGGGYQGGSGSDPMSDGCKLVQDGRVVFVTFNYRLGILGFLATPELRDSTAGFGVGNWGMLDQRMALQWVKDNIAPFGGDPRKVALTGESAGAYSTLLHLVAPGSRGLFSSAASFSGSADAMAVDFLRDAYRKGTRIRAALSCSALNSSARGYNTIQECMRAADADTVLAVQAALSVQTKDFCIPTIDGVFLAQHPVTLMQEGRTANVPVLLGVNANEGALEVLGQTAGEEGIDLRRFFEVITNLVTVPVTFFDWVYEQYNADVYYEGNWMVAAFNVITDAGYHCPSRRAAKYMAKQGIPVRYHILQASQPNSGCPLYVVTGIYLGQEFTDFVGALHGYDIPFTFLAPYRSQYSYCPFSEDETQLASFLSGIINSMAATGSPLPPRSSSLTSLILKNTRAWPAWSNSSSLVMNIDTAGPTLEPAANLLLDARCQLWDDILASLIAAGTSGYSY